MTQTNNEREALIEFKDAVKQLCNDFSSLRGNVYIKDVEASLDALCEQFIESPISQNEQQEAVGSIYDSRSGYGATITKANIPHGTELFTSPPKQAIPDGWKLVKISPNDKQLSIGADRLLILLAESNSRDRLKNVARVVYEGMVIAAPTNTEVGK